MKLFCFHFCQAGPKHIIFSSSDSSSSSSDSSDSEDEKTNKKSKPTVLSTTQSSTSTSEVKPHEVDAGKPNEKKKIFYEQTKEEQLNAVSYNESYLAVVKIKLVLNGLLFNKFLIVFFKN